MNVYNGRDVDELIAESESGYAEYSRLVPSEDLSVFNPMAKSYGKQWTQVVDKDRLPWLAVVAGVGGNMTGVPIAMFDRADRDAAKRYAADFESGATFCLCNGPRWCDYVNAMQSARKIRSHEYQQLISLGRDSGISQVTGNTITRHEMLSGYMCGLTASQM